MLVSTNYDKLVQLFGIGFYGHQYFIFHRYQDASYYHWLQARAYLTEAERASDGKS